MWFNQQSSNVDKSKTYCRWCEANVINIGRFNWIVFLGIAAWSLNLLSWSRLKVKKARNAITSHPRSQVLKSTQRVCKNYGEQTYYEVNTCWREFVLSKIEKIVKLENIRHIKWPPTEELVLTIQYQCLTYLVQKSEHNITVNWLTVTHVCN